MTGHKQRRSMRDRLQAEINGTRRNDDANLRMASKLKELVDNNKIDNDYDIEFIEKAHRLLTNGNSLTPNQEAYLEKCFHIKY